MSQLPGYYSVCNYILHNLVSFVHVNILTETSDGAGSSKLHHYHVGVGQRFKQIHAQSGSRLV